MKSYKFAALTLLLIILGMGACGCNMEQAESKTVNSENSVSQEIEIVNEMKAFFEKKYDWIDYRTISFLPSNWSQSYDELYLSVEINGREETFSVQRIETESGVEYRDNFFAVLIQDEVERELMACLPRVPEKTAVFAGMRVGYYPNSLDKDAGFEELVAEMKNIGKASLFVIVSDEGFDEASFQAFSDEVIANWEDVGLASWLNIQCVSEESFDTISRDSYRDITPDKITFKAVKEIGDE